MKIKQLFSCKKMAVTGIGLLFLWLSGCESGTDSIWTREKYRQGASALFQRELFRESIDLYEKYLRSDVIPEEDVPKVLYQVGNIYLENLKNPQAALARYTLVQSLYPEADFKGQLGKKIILCLERTGRSRDAKQALKSITEIGAIQSETSGEIPGSTVVAQIEDRKITLGELELALGNLPESPLETNQVISQYVSQILIAEAAERKGLGQQPEVLKKIDFMRNQILAQESLKEELNVTPPTQNDLKYYFEANAPKFRTGPDSLATFEQVAQKVAQAWMLEKQNEKYQSYIQGLLASDKVKIFGVQGNPSP